MSRGKLPLVAALLAAVASPIPVANAGVGQSTTDVPDIAFERYELDNGLEVILHHDRRVPLVAVDVWYHVGSGNETPGKSGFAHLFEHMMFQGAKHIGKDVHFDLLREIGASSVNGTTNVDRTNYFEVVPSHQLETALWLESDRMGYLLDLLDEKSLKNQIDVVRNERRQRYDNVPFGKDRFAVAAGLYPEKHPYRYLTIGRHEDIENADIDDVRAFFSKWYVPSNATLVLAGDFEIADAKKLVDKWFATFPELPEPKSEKPELPALTSSTRTEIEDGLARYTRLHFAWHSPAALTPGDAELTLLASVLASSGWGRLHKRLVIQDQTAQSVSAYQSGSGFSGEFHVVVDIKPEHALAKVEPVVVQEIERVIAEGITEQELARVTNRIEADFVWGLEDLLARAERLQFFNHYAGNPDFTQKWLERFRSRSVDDVRKAAADTLSKPRVEIVTRPAPGGGK